MARVIGFSEEESELYLKWLSSKTPSEQKHYSEYPMLAAKAVDRELVAKLSMLAEAEASMLTPDASNKLVLSVGNQRINREQMQQVRTAFRNAVGEDLNSKVVIVALSKLASV